MRTTAAQAINAALKIQRSVDEMRLAPQRVLRGESVHRQIWFAISDPFMLLEWRRSMYPTKVEDARLMSAAQGFRYFLRERGDYVDGVGLTAEAKAL